jgi:membrane protease YdiL (CAAX protease family)
MHPTRADKRQTIRALLTFVGVLCVAASVAHFAIVRLTPTSIYVGALMMTPTLAAFVTSSICGRRIADLPWRWGSHRANLRGYLLPALYVSVAYGLVWLLGLGGVANPETLDEWGQTLGLSGGSSLVIGALMVALLATVQFIKSLGSIAGEEIGWRGFLVWELRRLFSFDMTCLLSGLLWAVWHYPVILAYGGGGAVFQLACFTVMLVSMSVIMTYYTFTSGSLWPAVMFHGAHNIYIQKIYTPLTITSETSAMWIDEYGLMLPIVVTVLAAHYWRRARMERL